MGISEGYEFTGRGDIVNSYLKQKEETLKRYLDTEDIGSFIMMDATMAMSRAERGWDNDKRPDVAIFEQKWIHVYAKVNTDVADIAFKGKEWEFTHWMGFCPEDVKELLKLKHEWNHLDWENTPEERQTFMRDLWDPQPIGDDDYLKHWQPYFDRRVGNPLCETHDWNHFSGVTEKVKIMLGSSAGRVLLTIQDRYKHGDPKCSFDGAMVTLIFDGTSKNPRGGLQSLCAKRDEALGLIQDAIDNMPKLIEDQEIFIA